MNGAVPGVYGPDQPSQPLDLGDGLRARMEELEGRLEAVWRLCDAAADRERSDPRNSHAAYIRHTAIRDALRGDQ